MNHPSNVPELGFPNEEVPKHSNFVRRVKTKWGDVEVYRWSSKAEGYNVFLPDVSRPEERSRSFTDIFMVKMVIQDWINRKEAEDAAVSAVRS